MRSEVPSAEPGTLLCLPPAGTGRLAYAEWPDQVAEHTVEPVLYPGRDSRVSEPLAGSVPELVQDILHRHGAAIASGRFSLLGRSVGASLAMHLVAELVRAQLPLPRHIVLVASRPPTHPDPEAPLYRLSSRRLRERIADWGGMTQEELADDELMSWVLRLVRADLAAVETAPRLQRPIPVPLTAVGAAGDASVPTDVLKHWSGATTGQFTWHVLPGGHFPNAEQRNLLIALVAEKLSQPTPTSIER